jgi:hypothetical protein
MIVKQGSGSGLAALDDTHLPILITTFRGHVTLEMAQWHHGATSLVLGQRHALGLPVVYITDAHAMQVPAATVRKYWADIMKENEVMLNAMLGNFVVLNSPLMRGALTAIEWVTRLKQRIRYVASLEQAVVEANRLLLEHGHSPVVMNGTKYQVA